jgi:hypothetical protein
MNYVPASWEGMGGISVYRITQGDPYNSNLQLSNS